MVLAALRMALVVLRVPGVTGDGFGCRRNGPAEGVSLMLLGAKNLIRSSSGPYKLLLVSEVGGSLWALHNRDRRGAQYDAWENDILAALGLRWYRRLDRRRLSGATHPIGLYKVLIRSS